MYGPKKKWKKSPTSVQIVCKSIQRRSTRLAHWFNVYGSDF